MQADTKFVDDSCPILIAEEIIGSFDKPGEEVLGINLENNIEKPQKFFEDDISSLKEEKIEKVDLEKQEKEKIENDQKINDEKRILEELQAENKALKAENEALKEDVRQMSVHYTKNGQLQSKIAMELERSMNYNSSSKLGENPTEYVTITGMHEILENFLWLGDRFAANDTAVLKKLGITYLLTLYGTHEHEYSTPVKARCIPLNDDGSTDLGPVLKRCFEFIDEAKAQNQKILIHCVAGINRSPSIVIAYLMKTYQWKYRESLDFVQNKRWFIDPAPGYTMQLKQYEKVLFDENKIFPETLVQSSEQKGFSLASIFAFWFNPSGINRPIIF